MAGKRAPRPGEGRPTKYSEDILSRTIDYVSLFLDSEKLPKDEVIPSIEGLALYLDIARPTIYDWSSHEDKPEFSYIIEKLSACQGKILLNGTLKGTLNSGIGKAILSKHGYVEKNETDLTSKGKVIQGFTAILQKAYGDED